MLDTYPPHKKNTTMTSLPTQPYSTWAASHYMNRYLLPHTRIIRRPYEKFFQEHGVQLPCINPQVHEATHILHLARQSNFRIVCKEKACLAHHFRLRRRLMKVPAALSQPVLRKLFVRVRKWWQLRDILKLCRGSCRH